MKYYFKNVKILSLDLTGKEKESAQSHIRYSCNFINL